MGIATSEQIVLSVNLIKELSAKRVWQADCHTIWFR
jgi:hypothetical protein